MTKDMGMHEREEHLFEPWQNELRRAGYEGGFLLGELIEACEEEYLLIEHRNISGRRDWQAKAYTLNRDAPLELGATPEEAVARLWLALNKK